MPRVGVVSARATTEVAAPPERVLELLRDYASRERLLTDNYSRYTVQEGGTGAGTVFSYHFAAGGRERDYRLRVEEADGVLRERDELSSFVSEWTVTPAAVGSTVTVTASWQGAGGIAGIFEGLFAPLGLKRILGQVLANLATAAAA
jgi:carbon monoxide dehydrogenase subunit G